MASRAAEMALDRSRFEERLDLVALRVSALKTSAFMKRLSKQLLNVARVRNVERDGDDASKRLILLSKQIGVPKLVVYLNKMDMIEDHE